jgi:pimeloyl-ACP methyl ester carboxylesterase
MLRAGALKSALNWYRGVPFGLRSAPGRITVPTLYVYGTDDVALGRKAADATAGWVDGPYTYEVLEGVSHWVLDDATERVADLVRRHLADHPI